MPARQAFLTPPFIDPMTRRLRVEARSWILVAITVALACAAFVAVHIRQRAAEGRQQGMAAAESLAALTAHRIERALSEIDVALQLIESAWQRGEDLPDLHRRFQQLAAVFPQVTGFFFLDANGELLVDSGRHPPRPIRLDDRDYVRHHRTEPEDAGLFIGRPVRRRPDGKLIMPVSRRVLSSDGRLAGVLVAGVNTTYFEELPQVLHEIFPLTVSLLHDSGVLFAHTGGDRTLLGRVVELEAMEQRAARRDPIEHWLDQPESYVRLQRVASAPVLVAASVPVSAAGGGELMEAWPITVGFGLFALAMGVVAAANLRRIRHAATTEARDRQAAQALREQELRLRLAFSAAAMGVVDCDLVTQRVTWSPDVPEMLGLPPEVLETHAGRILEHMHPDDRQGSMARLESARREPSSWDLEYRIVRPDGEIRWINSIGETIAEAGEVPTRFITLMRDVTARKELERELEASRAAAEQASEAKSRFLAMMSHELRTRMNAIIGFSGLVEEAVSDDVRRRYARRIGGASRSLLGIINDVLDLSRIEAAGVELREADFELPALIEDVVAMFEPAASEKAISVRSSIAAGGGAAWLRGDPLRLRQVLVNLVGNAVKFTTEGGVTIGVTTEPAGAGGILLRVSVSDTGVGIEPDRLESLFRPFSQAHDDRRYGGTGLGLVISQRVVGAMGGRIEVRSEPGRGSEFRFEVPLLQCDRPTPQPPAILASAGAATAAHVLVVDDQPFNRELVQAVLGKSGFRVRTVSSGEEALTAAAQEKFDVILMDVQMPGMGGLAAASAIRALPGERARVPIVALSASVFVHEVAECRSAGMDDHLGKPFEALDLVQKVRSWSGGLRAAASDDRR